MPSLSDAEYQAGNKIVGTDVVDPSGNVVRSDNTTGTGPVGETTAPADGSQPSLPTDNTDDSSAGSILNYQQAARDALNEASATRKGAQLSALAPYTQGLPNSDLTNVIGMINQGAGAVADTAFSSFVAAQNTALNLQQTNKNNAFNLINQIASNDGFGELPDSAITALAKSSGISTDTLLGLRTAMASKDPLIREQTLATINNLRAQGAATNPESALGQAPLTMTQALGGDGPVNSTNDITQSRTDRNNNPVASSISVNGDGTPNMSDPATAEWINALKSTNIPFTVEQGDNFGSNRATINFPTSQNGLDGAITLLSDAGPQSAFGWYKNNTGKAALQGIDSPQAFSALSYDQKTSIVKQIYSQEQPGGTIFGGGAPASTTTNTTGTGSSTESDTVAVTDPSGKSGTIPSGQLAAALQAGYKVQPNADIANNPGLAQLFGPNVYPTQGGNQYLDMSKVPASLQTAATLWANSKNIFPAQSTDVQGISQIDTARKDISALSNIISTAKVSPQNWFQRLYQGPTNIAQTALQSNNQLSAYNTMLNQVITDLSAGGTIQGERIGTVLLGNVKDTLPNLSTDTVQTATAKINNWLTLINDKESSIFHENAPGQGSTGSGASGSTVSIMSPTGQLGTIPAAQLKDALAAGYKLQ